ncbi:MAG: FAD-binding oxidoreductase [Roseomonas sp.]|nr:FAD-binding oxidoreductase [Roseomonas sp.]
MLPPSLYAETAIPATPTPYLAETTRADVCVIGGGFTGLSAALHLAEGGADVVLLEAEEPGWGASGRNGGQVNPGLKPNPDEVEGDFGPDLGGRMLALSYGAPDAVFALIRQHQIRCEARQEGTIRAALGDRNADLVRVTAEQCARRGWPVSFLGAKETAEATGTGRYAGAMLDARGGDVQPLSYARGLARVAIQAGARVHGGSPVARLVRAAGGWRIETARGAAVEAESVVLATNGYTRDLWPGLRQSVVPVFSSIAASEPLPDGVARTIMPRRASLYEAGRVTVYYRMGGENRLLIGGRGPQREIRDASPIRYLTDYALRLWPQIAGLVHWRHGWNGRLAMTRDHYPHLHEPAPGLLAALGYNGRGVAMATVMGQQIARRLLGAPPALLDMPVTDVRPIPLHGFWKIGVQAKLWEGRILDRLGL